MDSRKLIARNGGVHQIRGRKGPERLADDFRYSEIRVDVREAGGK